MNYESELFFARSAARKAGEACIRILNQGVVAETKSDESPVTKADKESERLIVSILAEAFPEDGFLGEEGAWRDALPNQQQARPRAYNARTSWALLELAEVL